jgi:hypothetical protein
MVKWMLMTISLIKFGNVERISKIAAMKEVEYCQLYSVAKILGAASIPQEVR